LKSSEAKKGRKKRGHISTRPGKAAAETIYRSPVAGSAFNELIDSSYESLQNTDKTGLPLNFSLFGLILLVLVIFISSARLRSAYIELTSLEADEKGFISKYLRSDEDTWNEIVRYSRNLSRFFIHHRGFDGEVYAGAVTDEDMAENMAQLASTYTSILLDALNTFSWVILNPDSSPAELSEAAKLLDDTVAGVGPSYRDSFESHRQVRLGERVSNFITIQNYLEATEEFVYFLRDSILEQTFTNITSADVDLFLASEVYVVIDLADITDTFNGIPLNEGFARAGISGLIALPRAQGTDSVVFYAAQRALYSRQANLDYIRTVVNILIGLTLAAALLTTIIAVKVLIPDIEGAKAGVLQALRFYRRIPFLLKLILAVYAIAGAVSFGGAADELGFMDLPIIYGGVIVIIFTFMLIILAFRGVYHFSDEFECRLIKQIFSALLILRRLSPVLLPMVSIALMVLGLGTLAVGLYVIFALGASGPSFNYQFIIIGSGALALSILSFASLLIFSNYAESYYYIRIIASGSPVSIPEKNGFFAKPLNMLNGLSEGLQASLEEQLQAERTKTELITNVSHDLKTPLTSIINYVDLLKKSKIEDTAAKEYVEILENKSERLKVLIEDLFEAAKLTTGAMELTLEPVDIVQLLTQAIGELSEKFDLKDIEIRFKAPKLPSGKLIIMLDGQRMWRVFENLLNNMANYSPASSRAYINVELKGEFVEIVMKNVSLYPLDFDAAELFERFKRGDAARTTEGSGLGLSIAKDIVELHGGHVDITIDGDLFKVTIRLRV